MTNQVNENVKKLAEDPNVRSLIVLATYKDEADRTATTLYGNELDINMMLSTLLDNQSDIASVVIASVIAGNEKVRNEVTTMLNEHMKRGIKNND